MGRLGSVFLAASLVSCSTAEFPDLECSAVDAVVALSDFSSSGVGGITLSGEKKLSFSVEFGRDVVLSRSRDQLFLLARSEEKVYPLDADCGELRGSISVPGTNSNPQDLAKSRDGRFWVPRFSRPVVSIYAPNGTPAGEIDLRPYDEAGHPDASAIVVGTSGGKERLFVALERLDHTSDPTHPLLSIRPSELLIINPETATVEKTLPLKGRNPFGHMVEWKNNFYLAEAGNTWVADEEDAGIEMFDPERLESRLIVTERALGGSVSAIAMGSTCGAAILLGAGDLTATTLVTFNPDTGAVYMGLNASVLRTAGFDLTALAWKGDTLLVGDRRKGEGGFPIHLLGVDAACLAHERGVVNVPLPAVAFATRT